MHGGRIATRERQMGRKTYHPGEAYEYQLIIKKLLGTALTTAPEQEIVYRGRWRYTYREMAGRVHRLAHGLASLGVEPGDTVAVMDWDSHRYLECYFAVPMMGAVLQTVNWRLSEEQLVYTLNHAGAKVILLHRDFVPVWNAIRSRLETVRRIVLLGADDADAQKGVAADLQYEKMLADASPRYEFEDLAEEIYRRVSIELRGRKEARTA